MLTKKTNYAYYVLIGIAIGSMVLYSVVFMYMDALSIQGWTFEFWDAVFRGRLFELHTVFAENYRQLKHVSCGGNFLWLIPIAVWNLPLWIINAIGPQYSVLPQWMSLWTRLLYFIAVLVMARAITKIVDAENEAKLNILLLCIGSFEVVISTMYAGQDEIIYLAVFMLALQKYKEERYKQFFVYGVISAVMCPVMLLPLLYMTLDITKLWISILCVIVSAVPGVVYQAIVKNDEWYWFYHSSGFVMLDDMIGKNAFITPLGSVPLFLLFAMLIAYKTLFIPTMDTKLTTEKIYIIAVGMLAFSFFTDQAFYRWVIYVPFAVTMIYLGGTNRINRILFYLLACARAYWLLGRYYVLNSDFCSEWIHKEKGVFLYGRIYENIESLKYVEKVIVPMMYALVLLLVYKGRDKEKETLSIIVIDRIMMVVYALVPLVILAVFWTVS